ncbi:MAG: methyltransferase domain-containing protein [Elusimicrobiota bacterium]|jgi:SAM-dependent methyltransferase
MEKKLSERFTSWARNLRSGALFRALEEYSRGDVLDVGGWDFFSAVRKRPGIRFQTWTNLEERTETLFQSEDARYRSVIGDGEAMSFPDASFDTVLNIQVLEHTFEPIRMVREISRVLRPGGTAIFLIPQTAVLHQAPRYYYNFSRFWIQKALGLAGLEVIELRPLGGRWTSTASHLIHFFLHSFRAEGYSAPEYKRSVFFYLLFPVMCLYAAASVPLCLFLSLGDLTEEPNNHLAVARKPLSARPS